MLFYGADGDTHAFSHIGIRHLLETEKHEDVAGALGKALKRQNEGVKLSAAQKPPLWGKLVDLMAILGKLAVVTSLTHGVSAKLVPPDIGRDSKNIAFHVGDETARSAHMQIEKHVLDQVIHIA